MRRAVSLAVALLGAAAVVAAQTPQSRDRDAQTLTEFERRVKAYLGIHQQHEDSMPKLSNEATPEQIDKHQRSLAALIHKARAQAKVGDIFTRDVRALIRRTLFRVLSEPSGRQLRAAIMDENPGPLKLQVNGRYPDAVPLSSVPPEVIKALPRLPPELEFRFIGERLILFDVHAHMIVDYIESALPR